MVQKIGLGFFMQNQIFFYSSDFKKRDTDRLLTAFVTFTHLLSAINRNNNMTASRMHPSMIHREYESIEHGVIGQQDESVA